MEEISFGNSQMGSFNQSTRVDETFGYKFFGTHSSFHTIYDETDEDPTQKDPLTRPEPIRGYDMDGFQNFNSAFQSLESWTIDAKGPRTAPPDKEAQMALFTGSSYLRKDQHFDHQHF